MRVVIFEHSDQDGPEELEVPDGELVPPVRLGIGPHFFFAEGYWMIPAALVPAGAELVSTEGPDGFGLTIEGKHYRALVGPKVDRSRLKSVTRKRRGKKLRAR